MDNKNILNDKELGKVTGGGIMYEGREYDSVQLLDELIASQDSGDIFGYAKLAPIIYADPSRFISDIEKAGREIPDTLYNVLFLG